MSKLIVGKVVSKDKPWEDIMQNYINEFVKDFTYEIGHQFAIFFENGNETVFPSIIEDFEENDYGFWIETTDMLWRLDKVSNNDRRVGFTYEF